MRLSKLIGLWKQNAFCAEPSDIALWPILYHNGPWDWWESQLMVLFFKGQVDDGNYVKFLLDFLA